MVDDFKRDFFPETERHTLSFDITSDDWRTLQATIVENGWETDDGLRYLLAAGLAYAQGQARMAALNHPDADLAAEVKQLWTERMQTESRYAVMKFRAFSFMQAVKLLEMKLNACHAELESVRQALAHSRQA
jgi:hypothetical protein